MSPCRRKLGASGAPGAIVTAGGLVFVGGGDVALNAVDAMTGETLWQGAAPATDDRDADDLPHRRRDGRQFVVIAAGAGEHAELVAFALR